MPEQSTLADYYRRLLAWEGQPERELVHGWPAGLVDAVTADFATAVSGSGLKGLRCPITPGSTNQSIGNQVEAFVVVNIAAHFSSFRLTSCPGAGYPDKALAQAGTLIPLEIKATSDWNLRDSNRRVLTSSSSKLRTVFTVPVRHLLATILYQNAPSIAEITGLRLDFLQPDTPVNIRLEASVNHKILASGAHPHVVF